MAYRRDPRVKPEDDKRLPEDDNFELLHFIFFLDHLRGKGVLTGW